MRRDGGRLLSAMVGQASGDERHVMARALAGMAIIGALVITASLAVPGSGGQRLGLLGVSAAAAVLGGVLWFGAGRLSITVIHGILEIGIGLLTLAIHFGGDVSGSLAMLYVWVALYGSCFFSVRRTLVVGASIVLSCIVAVPSGTPHLGYFLLTVSTIGVACVFVQRLVTAIRATALVDPLTGIANRRRLDLELPGRLDRARRAGVPMSLVMLDLDLFKIWNDEHGHLAGDRLLAATGLRWSVTVRGGDLLARYGGEEFAVALLDCDVVHAVELAERLRASVPEQITCSAGVAAWDGVEPAEALLARADAALYEAKRRGRNRTVSAGDDDGGVMLDAAAWSATVLKVLDDHAVDVVFQPIVDLRSGRIAGYEALARPAGAAADLKVDGLFAAAQRMGRIRDLDWLCRRRAAEAARRLPADLPLFLNVSVAALLDPQHPVDQLAMLCRWTGRDPHTLVLEVTERETVTNADRLVEVIAQHRATGVRFALDDVGAGHSTLEVLAAALPEYIKVASPLTRHAESPGPQAAVLAAVAFAERTGAVVIAEGIELDAERTRMLELGAVWGQGWLLGVPAPHPVAA